MIARAKILSLFLSLFFCGCVKQSDLDQKISAPALLDKSIQAALESHTFAAGQWPDDKWWEIFGDDQLPHLIDKALEQSPTLQKAFSQVEAARENARVKKSALYPEIDMVAEDNWQHFSRFGFFRDYFPIPNGAQPPPAVANVIDLALDFSYEVDLWGKNRKLYRAAVFEMKAQLAETAMTALVLSTGVARLYFILQWYLAQRDILQQTLDIRQKITALTVQRKDFGLNNQMEINSVAIDEQQLQQMLVVLDKEIALTKHSLNLLLGQGPDADLGIESYTLIFSQPIPLPTKLGLDLIARRPDVMAQIWRVESAAKQIGVAKTAFYPNLEITAFAGLEALKYSNLFLWASKNLSLFPAIHLPIFTGGRLKANLNSKVAEFNSAVYEYNDMILRAAKEVADALKTISSLTDQTQVQDLNVTSAASTSELQLQRYEEGIDNILSAYDAEISLLNEQLSSLDLVYNQAMSVVDLIKALGGGYHTPYHVPGKFEVMHE